MITYSAFYVNDFTQLFQKVFVQFFSDSQLTRVLRSFCQSTAVREIVSFVCTIILMQFAVKDKRFDKEK